jgi:SAM-dependent methyltransferase
MISLPQNAEACAPEGFATMSPVMAELTRYPRYLFGKIEPAVGQRILEIGVGYGQYTPWLLERGDVLAADISEECLASVMAKHSSERLHTVRIDLNDTGTLAPCEAFGPDSIVCINVLEHIEDDVAALSALHRVIAPAGRIALIVPAHPRLYGRMDDEAGHYRRYTRRSLRETSERAGWAVESCNYINALAAAGWWLHNRVRRTAGLSDARANRDIRRADRWLAAFARWTDPILRASFGLSVAAIARK